MVPDPGLHDLYAGLGAGDPDPDEWLPDIPADADDQGPWTGDGEVFAAGFLHHDTGGQYATGFASGGELDVLDPGPQLAGYLASAAVTAAGHGGLGESALLGVLCGWQRLGAWAAAGHVTDEIAAPAH